MGAMCRYLAASGPGHPSGCSPKIGLSRSFIALVSENTITQMEDISKQCHVAIYRRRREKEKERKRKRKERQTERKTERKAERKTERKTERKAERKTERKNPHPQL